MSDIIIVTFIVGAVIGAVIENWIMKSAISSATGEIQQLAEKVLTEAVCETMDDVIEKLEKIKSENTDTATIQEKIAEFIKELNTFLIKMTCLLILWMTDDHHVNWTKKSKRLRSLLRKWLRKSK